MDNLIHFPVSGAASMVDPPAVAPDHLSAIIELEHELADLQVAVAVQAVKLSKRHSEGETFRRRLRLNAAVLLAFSTGWLIEPPTPLQAGIVVHDASHATSPVKHEVCLKSSIWI